MAVALRIAFQSVRWTGPAPLLVLEHGAEQRSQLLNGGRPPRLEFPYVPSRTVDIMAFDPARSGDERGFLAGATVSVEQVLQQTGGSAAVGLFDTNGALKGRVQLSMELAPIAPPPHAAPLLASSPRPGSPFADPEIQRGKVRGFGLLLGRSRRQRAAHSATGGSGGSASGGSASGGSARSSKSGQPGGLPSREASGAAAQGQGQGQLPSSFSPLTAGRGHLAARRRQLPEGEAPSDGSGQSEAAPPSEAEPGSARSGGGGGPATEAPVAAAPPAAQPEPGLRRRRAWRRGGGGEEPGLAAGPPLRPRTAGAEAAAAAGADGADGSDAAVFSELARHNAERRAAGAHLLMTLAQQTADDARRDDALLSALRDGLRGSPRAGSPRAGRPGAGPAAARAQPQAGGDDDGDDDDDAPLFSKRAPTSASGEFVSPLASFTSSLAGSSAGGADPPTPRLGGPLLSAAASAGGARGRESSGSGGRGGEARRQPADYLEVIGQPPSAVSRRFRHGYPSVEPPSPAAAAAAAAAPEPARGGRGGAARFWWRGGGGGGAGGAGGAATAALAGCLEGASPRTRAAAEILMDAAASDAASASASEASEASAARSRGAASAAAASAAAPGPRSYPVRVLSRSLSTADEGAPLYPALPHAYCPPNTRALTAPAHAAAAAAAAAATAAALQQGWAQPPPGRAPRWVECVHGFAAPEEVCAPAISQFPERRARGCRDLPSAPPAPFALPAGAC
ncbi:hypothetical protein Rsub_11202 [Raphidocelis subcapitata]|uniref:Uncharacterized protein n=1 Tax=Raphidocelis subcapitata TaxID=307507 RepID=A0A2V0PFR5_9CHLO|nr:hypothetical protein Rsub_11202 [Raphidocelis subcapitata]|eukprot:GBF97852.1 hypothetical protein Rsub_11202 [Raphidocelis subcapitata]